MTRLKLSDFEKLRDSDSSLFHALLPVTQAEPGGQVVAVDDASLGEAFKIAFAKFTERNPDKVLPVSAEELAALEEEKKKEADRAHVMHHSKLAADHYIKYWCEQRGLLKTESNYMAVLAECERIQKGDPGAIMSVQLIDVAIGYITPFLHWKPAEPVAAPQPPPTPKIGGTSEDQLSINENRTWVLKAASDVQIRDLARRQARRDRPELFSFSPLPAEITRRQIVNATKQQIEKWQRMYGTDAIDARLQGRG